jgi:hypothetical protein
MNRLCKVGVTSPKEVAADQSFAVRTIGGFMPGNLIPLPSKGQNNFRAVYENHSVPR